MFSAILFVLRTGVSWRDLPEQYGLWSSVYARYRCWRDSGLFTQMLAVLAKDAVCELGTWIVRTSSSINMAQSSGRAGGAGDGLDQGQIEHQTVRPRRCA